MTFTAKTMEWFDQNRHRSYPMRRDEWRNKVSPESGLDCLILDALIFDSDASGAEELEILGVEVASGSTIVRLRYGDMAFQVELSGGEVSGEGSYEGRRGVVMAEGRRGASFSLVFSSHAYILDRIGEGRWELGCRTLKTRVVSLSDGFGVDGISVNGSECVAGHDSPAVACGDVVLEDGFRTSPIINNGRVVVRVGVRYGEDPCFYDCGKAGTVDCRSPLFFICGQNAINSGNVVIKGGKGVSVEQGRTYKMKDGGQAGKYIPCVEIIANEELMDIYRPEISTSDA